MGFSNKSYNKLKILKKNNSHSPECDIFGKNKISVDRPNIISLFLSKWVKISPGAYTRDGISLVKATLWATSILQRNLSWKSITSIFSCINQFFQKMNFKIKGVTFSPHIWYVTYDFMSICETIYNKIYDIWKLNDLTS